MSAERTTFPGLDLRGSIGLVTGGGSGIGLETALTLADLGADVAVFDLDGPAAERAAERIQAIGRRTLAVTGDAASEADVQRAFSAVSETLGDVDIAVACAGVLGDYQPIASTSVEHFDRVIAVNVRGSFLVIREAVPHMRRRGRGAIIVLSSLDGLQAEPGMASYCTSKGALLNLARAAALDLARESITVNAVCPSVTLTPLLEGRLATLPDGDAVLAQYAAKHPLGRVLQPRDIAATIAFLVSPLATGITGTAVPVDAGKGAAWDDYKTPPWLSV
ncbi:MAG: SDR family oxidoreductase [Chloroflexi bacterium]|nr:SDR family oxidoreductase [Chloroflexota bacterium]